MSPFMLVFNDVFPEPDFVRRAVLEHEFESVTSPVDQVTYPMIARANVNLQTIMLHALARVFPRSKVDLRFCFARAMPAGETQPHHIHQDKVMADYSAHIYLNPAVWPGTGTQFWRHPLFGERYDPSQDLPWTQHDDPAHGTWRKTSFVLGRYNRLLVHASELWHSAEPNHGWGKTKDDARLVVTTFFDLR